MIISTYFNNGKYYKLRIVIPVVVGSSPISHPINTRFLAVISDSHS